jgi:signal transduction histidine kinase/CheY-like chemotaxis protein
MDQNVRQSGIEAIGDIQWGTHFCQFYRTKEDLADTLVPYFEAGLRSNESCLWITSEPLEAQAAESLMVDALPDFKKNISSGQIQILSMKDWYIPGSRFSADDVLQGWVDKEAESRARGFSGLRLTGNTFWLDRSGWDDFMEYEKKVNHTFGHYKLVALCTYCLDKCTADDVIDVCRHHEFALARRRGTWEVLESASLKIAKDNLRRLNLELESRVEQRTTELNAALRGRDEFLAMLGHELRNPLAPIRNATELVRKLTPPESPLSKTAAVLDRQVRHITRLVDDLLDVGRITQGQIHLEMKVVSLTEILEQAVELSHPMIDQRGHSFSVSLPSRHVKVNADATRLAQVFGNLLHNAAKYTPDGGNVSLSTTIDEDSVKVTVRDTGAGIPSTMLSSIFDLFTQLPRSLARSDGGLGIGLTLVKRISEMHGGSVEAFSEGAGTGAEFSVRLPLAFQHVPAIGPAAGWPLRKSGSKSRILVVDDNEDSNRTISALLELAGYEVASAYDGHSGLLLSKSFLPTTVLLDLGLPGIDGYEVARRLKADPATAQAHIIALTGYGQPADVIRTRDAGFADHLLKPAAIEDILTIIARASNSKLH